MEKKGNIEPSETLMWDAFIRRNDKKAYEYIYNRYVQSLFIYGLRYTSNKEVIKDCIQDVFIKIHDNRHKLKITDHIRFYLFVSLKNSLLNHFRDEKVQLEIGNYESLIHESSTEEIYIEGEIIELRKAKADIILASLSDRQREAMYYKFIENKEHKEIAQIMDMNSQSVSNILQRSIQKIKKIYGKERSHGSSQKK
ncbi:MAG: sigma-70 family RNA polymerase sigma factor [Bacteroidales bacterium]|jgi:RNA polymerase sigma factor (sigma-70 family)|nr:sigma-70 family RNA polymerase sigma factor [Bacteroidales bacterium]